MIKSKTCMSPVILDFCMLFSLLLHTMDVWLNRWTQKKNYERLQKALDSVMSIREMTQVQEGGGRERKAIIVEQLFFKKWVERHVKKRKKKKKCR